MTYKTSRDDDDHSSVSSLGGDHSSSVYCDELAEEQIKEVSTDKDRQPSSTDESDKMESKPRRARPVSLARAAELTLDAITGFIAMDRMNVKFECCDEEGDWVLTEAGRRLTTLSFLGWVGFEWILLLCSMKQYQGSLKNSISKVQQKNAIDHLLAWLVCLNPLGGCAILYTLLHSRDDVLLVWMFQGGAVLCLVLSFWLQHPRGLCLWTIQLLLPIVPWVLSCVALWYTMNQGGICFHNGAYWNVGCDVCSTNGKPASDESCSDLDTISQGSYCGHDKENRFCYFDY